MRSTRFLVADHELILQALHVLNAITSEILQGNQVDNPDLHSLLDFLREVAGGCHHVKEEAIWLPALMQAGMSTQEGPLRAMIDEHERERALAAAMRNAIDRKNMEDFVKYSGRYARLLSKHMEYENRSLFPKADQILSDEDDEEVTAAFDNFQNVIVGPNIEKRLRHIIEVLASKYRAVPSLIAGRQTKSWFGRHPFRKSPPATHRGWHSPSIRTSLGS
jgi:hemerythrin-like domain-containing protein